MWGLIIALLGAPAQGAGYYFSDLGPRAMGRGGAVVAGVDDLTAQYFNPAALIRLGPQVQVQLAGVDQYVKFDRADVDGEEYAPVENQAAPYAIPTFGVSHDLGIDRFHMMVGFYAPYAPDLSYPADGAQRYTLIDTQLIQTAFGPSAAYAVTDWLTVGAGLTWNLLYIEQELAVTVDLNPDPQASTDDPDFDVSYRVQSLDKSEFSGNLGVLVEPAGGSWALGLSVQPPIEFQGTGPMTADFGDHFLVTSGIVVPTNEDGTEAVYSDPETTLTVKMPWIVRGGALVRSAKGLEIEAAVVWQGWDIIDTVVVDDVSIVLQTELGGVVSESEIEGPIELPASYINAWSYRLGGSYAASDSLTLRVGGLYETSAVPAKTQGVSLVDGVKTGLGLGLTWSRGNLDVDIGVLETFFKPLEVSDSEVTAIRVEALSGDVSENPKVVGNGTFESRMDMAAMALTWRFGSGAGG